MVYPLGLDFPQMGRPSVKELLQCALNMGSTYIHMYMYIYQNKVHKEVVAGETGILYVDINSYW